MRSSCAGRGVVCPSGWPGGCGGCACWLNGQKRHVVVDTLGLLLCVMVTAASVQDRDGASGPVAAAREVLHHHAGLG
ncbi:transposase [Nonomuraea sp. NPDC001699]